MTTLLKKPLFWTNVAGFVFAAWLIAGMVLGFNNPPVSPPGGSGAIQVDSSNNVGIGGAPTADKFSVSGNVSWTGSLTGGSVPWARLTSVPADCAPGSHYSSLTGTCSAPAWSVITGKPPACLPGQYVTTVAGATLGCTNLPGGGGNVSTVGGTAGTIAKFTGATSIGNSGITDNGAGTVTVTGNITVTANAWGATVTGNGPESFNSSGYWGGAAGAGSTGASWNLTCPAGQFLVGIGQANLANGHVRPYITCATL